MAMAMAVTRPLGLHAHGHLVSLLVWATAGLGGYAAYLRIVLKIRLADLAPRKQVREAPRSP